MAALSRLVAAGAALACVLAAGPAMALTLTFQIHVISNSGNAPPIDDFQMTWTFEPTDTSGPAGPQLFGEVAGFIETPATAHLLELAKLDPSPSSYVSYGLMETTHGSNTAVRFVQAIYGGDEIAERYSEYQNRIEASGDFPLVANTPGGMVHVLQTLGDLRWTQQAVLTVGGYILPREEVDRGLYIGTASLIAWDVAPENLAVPEPSTWALMILGFGSAGVALRRRRQLA